MAEDERAERLHMTEAAIFSHLATLTGWIARLKNSAVDIRLAEYNTNTFGQGIGNSDMSRVVNSMKLSDDTRGTIISAFARQVAELKHQVLTGSE